MNITFSFLKNKSIKSFTLIELLIVIVIIGILATALIPRLTGAQASARDMARIADMRQVQTALEMYYNDHGSYPFANLNSGCSTTIRETPLAVLVTGGYMTSLPKDPKGGSYCYHYTAVTPPTVSGRSCNDKRRSDYQYTIYFVLEKERKDVFTTAILGSDKFNHCVAGPLH